jgi:CRP-like cAMP-binding protein
MTFMQADARIAQLLLENETNGKVNLTHEEIATAVGASRVTVSKALGRFADSGMIETCYGSVVIKSREKIKEKFLEKC